MRSILHRTLWALSVLILAAPAVAQTTPAQEKPKKGDPNEVICERQQELGSRLATRKVCMTRAQWEEQRRSDRDLVTRSQINSCVRAAGC